MDPIREAEFLGRINEGMDVCDVDGQTVGTVARVHRAVSVASGSGAGGPPESVVEVKTGFLGLGKHLYVPISAIQDTAESCLCLTVRKSELQHGGWEAKPDYLR